MHYHAVSEEDSQMMLHNYLAEQAGLRQSKYLCYAGGCGSCIVSATYPDPVTDKNVTVAVNSVSRPNNKIFNNIIYYVCLKADIGFIF